MSKHVYEIEYDTLIQTGQIVSALMDVCSYIGYARKGALSKLDWAPETSTGLSRRPEFDVDKPIFEASVPPEFTEDLHVFNEVLRVVSIDEKKIQVMVTDASIPPTRCEAIAIDFAERLYGKATGRNITREQVLIRNIAGLPENICEHCLLSIGGLPHVCKVCGRTFCYDHRGPETHGCPSKLGFDQAGLPIVKHRPAITTTRERPRVTIRKIPCG